MGRCNTTYIDAPRLLNTSQLGRYLGVSARTIQRWYWKHLLPAATLIEGRRYWRKPEIDEMLESKRERRLVLAPTPAKVEFRMG